MHQEQAELTFFLLAHFDKVNHLAQVIENLQKGKKVVDKNHALANLMMQASVLRKIQSRFTLFLQALCLSACFFLISHENLVDAYFSHKNLHTLV